jgi:hypothetical protein
MLTNKPQATAERIDPPDATVLDPSGTPVALQEERVGVPA